MKDTKIKVKESSWNDYKIEQIIGVLLRVGVSLSALLVLGSGIAFLALNYNVRADHHTFHQERAALTGLTGVIDGAAHLQADAIIQLGLLILIATPVARVLFAVFAFALEKDWTYVVVSLIVFCVLMATLTGWVV